MKKSKLIEKLINNAIKNGKVEVTVMIDSTSLITSSDITADESQQSEEVTQVEETTAGLQHESRIESDVTESHVESKPEHKPDMPLTDWIRGPFWQDVQRAKVNTDFIVEVIRGFGYSHVSDVPGERHNELREKLTEALATAISQADQTVK